MAGLYIHVPFCARRCVYCDFFSNTEMKYSERYVKAIIREMGLRKAYLEDASLETVYFGGGTPSQLSVPELKQILDAISIHFQLVKDPEITLEANPDDITPEYLEALKELPVNRISMGIQSFKENDLRFLNRRHTSEQAIEAVRLCQSAGYTNLSIDLIYGLPGLTLTEWEENVRQAINLDIPHISAYHLIYEEGTALNRQMEDGLITPVDEETSLAQFETLIASLTGAGYTHYEISNFARPGYLSRHNSSYWKGIPYLGLGPSAHSYNGKGRDWNVSSLPGYLRGIEQHLPDITHEPSDLRTGYNDYVITGLRTIWGIDLIEIRNRFGAELHDYCLLQSTEHIEKENIKLQNNKLLLTHKGLFISDTIMRDLLKI